VLPLFEPLGKPIREGGIYLFGELKFTDLITSGLSLRGFGRFIGVEYMPRYRNRYFVREKPDIPAYFQRWSAGGKFKFEHRKFFLSAFGDLRESTLSKDNFYYYKPGFYAGYDLSVTLGRLSISASQEFWDHSFVNQALSEFLDRKETIELEVKGPVGLTLSARAMFLNRTQKNASSLSRDSVFEYWIRLRRGFLGVGNVAIDYRRRSPADSPLVYYGPELEYEIDNQVRILIHLDFSI